MFNEKFINQLPGDATAAIIVICKKFLSFSNSEKNPFMHYKKYMEALGFLEAFAEAKGLELTFPKVDNKREQNIERIINFFEKLAVDYEKKYQQITLDRMKAKFAEKLGTPCKYDFSETDILKVQKEIAIIRTSINKTNELDALYMSKLLKRLDQLQRLPYKNLYDLDPFWGLIGEIGVIKGMLGIKAAQITDRIRDLAKTIWTVQLKAEGLPAKTPLPVKW